MSKKSVQYTKFTLVSYPSKAYADVEKRLQELYRTCEPDELGLTTPFPPSYVLIGWVENDIASFLVVTDPRDIYNHDPTDFELKGGDLSSPGWFITSLCGDTVHYYGLLKRLLSELRNQAFKHKRAYLLLHVSHQRPHIERKYMEEGFFVVGNFKDNDEGFTVMRSNVSSIGMEISCQVCGTPCSQACRGCFQVAYCSEEHHRQDWENSHSKTCASVIGFVLPPERYFMPSGNWDTFLTPQQYAQYAHNAVRDDEFKLRWVPSTYYILLSPNEREGLIIRWYPKKGHMESLNLLPRYDPQGQPIWELPFGPDETYRYYSNQILSLSTAEGPLKGATEHWEANQLLKFCPPSPVQGYIGPDRYIFPESLTGYLTKDQYKRFAYNADNEAIRIKTWHSNTWFIQLTPDPEILELVILEWNEDEYQRINLEKSLYNNEPRWSETSQEGDTTKKYFYTPEHLDDLSFVKHLNLKNKRML